MRSGVALLVLASALLLPLYFVLALAFRLSSLRHGRCARRGARAPARGSTHVETQRTGGRGHSDVQGFQHGMVAGRLGRLLGLLRAADLAPHFGQTAARHGGAGMQGACMGHCGIALALGRTARKEWHVRVARQRHHSAACKISLACTCTNTRTLFTRLLSAMVTVALKITKFHVRAHMHLHARACKWQIFKLRRGNFRISHAFL